MNHRYLLWLLPVALVLGLGWYKSDENWREIKAQSSWRNRIAVLEAESQIRYQELRAWADGLHQAADPQRDIADMLNHGQRLPLEKKADHEVFFWRHPEYGIEMDFNFSGEKLISHGSRRSSPEVMAATPRPPLFTHDGLAESLRRMLPVYAIACWFIAFGAAVVWQRYGLVAAEAMLVISLVSGTAWLVSPMYDFSLRGILSNDSLAFAVPMYLVSVVAVAFRLPADRPAWPAPADPSRLRARLDGPVSSLPAACCSLHRTPCWSCGA